MPKEIDKSTKIRIFEMFDDLRERMVRVETSEETEKAAIAELRADVKKLHAIVNQFIGKNTVMAAVYGIIGSVVSGVIVFFVSKGGAQ